MRRAQKLLDDAVAIVAYAEVRAILLAWAGLPAWSPATRARAMVGMLLAEGATDGLVEQAQSALRAETRLMLDRRRVAPWPFDHSLGRGQLGTTDGIEAIFHVAGKAAGAYRGNDPRIMPLAIGLADFVRCCREGHSPR